MTLVFIKGPEKMDWMDLFREGRADESTLSKHGFLLRVAEGGSASFGMQTEPLSDAVERLVEVFQGGAWSGGTSAAEDMLA
jgi:hypothetical protein